MNRLLISAKRFSMAVLLVSALLSVAATTSVRADFLLGTITFNSPAGFTQSWDTVQFTFEENGDTTLFAGSPNYAAGQSGTTAVTSGPPFNGIASYLTDASNTSVRFNESFVSGVTPLGGLWQDTTESASIVKTGYGNSYPGLVDFNGYTIDKLELTVNGLTNTHPSTGPNAGQYVATYTTVVNIYGTLDSTPVPEPGQVSASLLAVLGLGGFIVYRRKAAKIS